MIREYGTTVNSDDRTLYYAHGKHTIRGVVNGPMAAVGIRLRRTELFGGRRLPADWSVEITRSL